MRGLRVRRVLGTVCMACALATAAQAQQAGEGMDRAAAPIEAIVEAGVDAAAPADLSAGAGLAEVVGGVALTAREAGTRIGSGWASWYGGRFHGRKTASGETFDMNALTAAHPHLPFGSWVRVRSLVNGLSVDVRINDRGPHIKRRIIDLSRAAARALGLTSQGTKQVEITLLDERR